MMDRFDLVIPVQALKVDELQTDLKEESSQQILLRVENARLLQHQRYNNNLMINAHVDGKDLHQAVSCEPSVDEILRKATSRFNL